MATHVDIVAQFDDRSVMVSANDLKRNIERTGNEAGDAFAKGFEKSAPRIQKAYEQAYSGAEKAASKLRAEEARLSDVRNRAQKEAEQLAVAEQKVEHYRTNLPNLTATLAAEERKLNDLRERHNSTMSQLTVRNEAFTRSVTDQRTAMTDLGRAFSEIESAASGAGGGGGLGGIASGLGGGGGFGGPALAAGVAVLGQALSDLIGVAASASQALIALPAAAGAAGAAFGTLQLATLGFDDALKAIADPKKFTEALKGLSPDAQRAALAIHSLMPEFEQLKNATQDAFFANVAPQLKSLTDQLLPMVEQTTTGIASAFNAAFQGVANQLKSPETKSALDAFSQNVTKAFDALTPATAPLTKAFGDLLSVGSGVLPQIAVAATNAASAFSAFIEKANQSGELKSALDAGLNTLTQLVPVATHFGEAFLKLAPIGEKVLPDVVRALDQTAAELPSIIKLASDAGNIFRQWSDALTVVGPLVKVIDLGFEGINAKLLGIGPSLGDLLNPLHQFADLINSIKWFFDPGSRPQPLRDQVLKEINDKRAQMGLPPMAAPDSGAPAPGNSPADKWSQADAAAHPNGASGGGALIPGQYRRRDGSIGYVAPPSLQTANPGGGSSASGPKLPGAPALPYDTSLPPGFTGVPQTTEVVSAENAWMDARHTLAEKQARLQQLEKTVGATADDITKAKNDVINAQQAQQQAELRLNDTQNKQLKTQTAALSEFGVKLDQDLGISKGLAGIADNLVRFLGSLAVAPWEAKMNAIANAPGQAQGGFGLLGVLGAQGAFGAQYTAAGQAAASGNGASALGPAALRPGGAYPGDAALLANVPSGSYAWGGGDLSKGLTDCSGAVTDLVNILDTGSTTAAHDASTGDEAQWLTQRGFLPTNTPMPGTFQVGLDADHTQATLPGGTEFNWGNNTDAANRGVAPNSGGAWMPGFTQHFYRPVDGSAGMPMGTPAGGGPVAPSGFGGFPIPLPVTIVGGGGAPGGAPVGAPGGGAGGGGAGGAPDPSAPPTTYPTSPGASDPYSPANTNPALNNPPAPGASPGMPGLPTGVGGAGNGPFLGAPGPGAGAPPGGPGAGPTRIGGGDGLSGSGKGGIGASDSTMALAGMAASALDVMAPGAGQAAQTAMKLANRAIQYGGQVAGIAAQGAIDTFLPFGGSKLASNSWATKLIGGIAGAAPALPNMAGKPAGPPAPGSPGSGNGSSAAPGTGGDTNITVNNNRPTEDGTGRDVAHAMQNQYQPPAKP